MASLTSKLSVESLMALNPCTTYPRGRVEVLVTDPGFLLAIPASDAYWALARLLSRENRIVWASACIRRAKGYAKGDAAYYAAYAANAHADTAAYAAYAAAAAAAYGAKGADDAAYARKAENLEAICHAVSLLETQ